MVVHSKARPLNKKMIETKTLTAKANIMNTEEAPQITLEETQQPQTPHDLAKSDETRRGKYNEWLLIGLVPKTGVPIWRYDWDMRELNSKYPCAKLRALRAERGVGGGQAKRRKLAKSLLTTQ